MNLRVSSSSSGQRCGFVVITLHSWSQWQKAVTSCSLYSGGSWCDTKARQTDFLTSLLFLLLRVSPNAGFTEPLEYKFSLLCCLCEPVQNSHWTVVKCVLRRKCLKKTVPIAKLDKKAIRSLPSFLPSLLQKSFFECGEIFSRKGRLTQSRERGRLPCWPINQSVINEVVTISVS